MVDEVFFQFAFGRGVVGFKVGVPRWQLERRFSVAYFGDDPVSSGDSRDAMERSFGSDEEKRVWSETPRDDGPLASFPLRFAVAGVFDGKNGFDLWNVVEGFVAVPSHSRIERISPQFDRKVGGLQSVRGRHRPEVFYHVAAGKSASNDVSRREVHPEPTSSDIIQRFRNELRHSRNRFFPHLAETFPRQEVVDAHDSVLFEVVSNVFDSSSVRTHETFRSRREQHHRRRNNSHEYHHDFPSGWAR